MSKVLQQVYKKCFKHKITYSERIISRLLSKYCFKSLVILRHAKLNCHSTSRLCFKLIGFFILTIEA